MFTRITAFAKKNLFAITLLAMAWLIFFSPLIIGGQIYFFDDLKILYLPIEHWYAQAQHAGELPVWSNYFGFGQPTIAWGQLGFFTPLHLLMRALFIPPLQLLQISVMAYFAIGLGGMFVFLRRHVSSVASALGSSVFVFSGFAIGHIHHVNFYTATMLLPWLLVALDYLIAKPTLRRALYVSLIGAAMALSGQPQVVAYSFGIATIVAFSFGITRLPALFATRELYRLIGLSLLAAILAFGLASFAILPLYEFLPFTERNGDLPETELLEFSYPPYYGITLLFPYFFGDYDHYAGPKGFQELAGFVGIIPLLLAGVGIFQGKRRALQIAAGVLVASGLLMMLGKYSPLYSWLVHEKFITSLNIPGRFIFFFDTGIALAAGIGFDRLSRHGLQTAHQRLAVIVAMLAMPILVLVGFFWQVQQDSTLFALLQDSTSLANPAWWLLWIGAGVVVAAFLLFSRLTPQWRRVARGVVASLAVFSLVALAYNYTPRSDRSTVGEISPYVSSLVAHEKATGLPARVYSDETILAQVPTDPSTHPTERIGPQFTVYQNVLVRKADTACVQFPIRVNRDFFGTTTVALHSSVSEPPIESFQLPPAEITSEEFLPVCFEKLPEFSGKTVTISFAGEYLTPLEFLYTAYSQELEPAYFVRKNPPTPEQLLASKKSARLIFNFLSPTLGDPQGVFLPRHLQVLGHASSAQWVSALSPGNYRAFIQHFFANDRGAVDGDGIHALVRFRQVLNMVGVTHLIQTLPLGAEDGLVSAGFTLLDSRDIGPKEVRLYANPNALPKAFFVRRAFFIPAADETRFAIQFNPYEPTQVGYISGNKPSAVELERDVPLTSTATLLHYTSTRVDVATTTSRPAFLMVSDTTTPQWQTFIDDQPADYYVGNTMLKTALVPAGEHTVSFRYHSPAISASIKLTLGALVVIVVLFTLSFWKRRPSPEVV